MVYVNPFIERIQAGCMLSRSCVVPAWLRQCHFMVHGAHGPKADGVMRCLTASHTERLLWHRMKFGYLPLQAHPLRQPLAPLARPPWLFHGLVRVLCSGAEPTCLFLNKCETVRHAERNMPQTAILATLKLCGTDRETQLCQDPYVLH